MRSNDPLAQFRKLLSTLEREKAALEKRLAEINETLAVAKGGKTVKAVTPQAPVRRRNKISAAGRKRIAEAQKARWAKLRAEKAKAAK
jgi:hypothetical protein